jgi:hypothetical protein
MEEDKLILKSEEIIELLKCPICLGILKDPVIELPNQHTFCRSCMFKYMKTQIGKPPECPVCKEQIHFLKDSLLAKNLLSTVYTFCEFKEKCSWNGNLIDYSNHKKECEYFIEVNKLKLTQVCEQMRKILSNEINPHLIQNHLTVFNDHVKNWDWLESINKDWKWWWWAKNPWFENVSCEECNILWHKYENEIEKYEEDRIDILNSIK